MFITSWAISSIIYDASFKPENTSLTDIGQLQGFNMPLIHQSLVYHIVKEFLVFLFKYFEQLCIRTDAENIYYGYSD